MKLFITFIGLALALAACIREPEENVARDSAPNSIRSVADARPLGNEQPAVATDSSTDETAEVEAEAPRHIDREPGTDELSRENIVALLTLVPKLQAHGLFWKWIGTIPRSQLRPFRDAIISSLKAMKPIAGDPADREFRDAYRVAKNLRDSEVARLALQQLPLAEPYRFPDAPPPKGWPEGTHENIDASITANKAF